MKPRIQIGDSVEVAFPGGRQRIGMIQAIEYDAVRVLIGGAEGQRSITISPEKFNSAGPSLWRVQMDLPST